VLPTCDAVMLSVVQEEMQKLPLGTGFRSLQNLLIEFSKMEKLRNQILKPGKYKSKKTCHFNFILKSSVVYSVRSVYVVLDPMT
jgi:hypothetical protein